MIQPADLLEAMPMPDPYFPVKFHRVRASQYGETLFTNHWHKHIELLFFISGKALIECNSAADNVQVGELVVFNSNDLHAGISQSEDLFYYVMIIDPILLQSQSIDATETKFITPITQNRILFNNFIKRDVEIGDCLLSIVHELEEQEFGYELAVKSLLFRILTLLLRKYVARILTPNDYKIRIKNLERFTPILQYIEASYFEELSVHVLADKAGLSRFHFSRLFKDLTGRTLTDYINEIRVGRAEYLLRNTPLTISEIAINTGFHDIYYFSRIFKIYKHMPPSELRKAISLNP